MSAETLCETPGCKLEARLQCPTCIKLEIKGSFFCSQECFKENWNLHKSVHKKPTQETAVYNPWPNYHYTGNSIDKFSSYSFNNRNSIVQIRNT